MPLDASSLAGKAAGGDTDAFAALYDLFFSRIYNYVRYRCNDDETADDLTAQIFERVLVKVASYSPANGSFEPWLFTIARNIVTDYHRNRRLRIIVSWEEIDTIPSNEISPEEAAENRNFENQVLAALSFLKNNEREMLGLRFGLGLKNHEIAELTGLREGNVAVKLHRATQRLREIIEASPEFEKQEAFDG